MPRGQGLEKGEKILWKYEKNATSFPSFDPKLLNIHKGGVIQTNIDKQYIIRI